MRRWKAGLVISLLLVLLPTAPFAQDAPPVADGTGAPADAPAAAESTPPAGGYEHVPAPAGGNALGAVPLRDLVQIHGVRENQLVGYGIVVGLNGTGDGTQAKFTVQSIANALRRMGVVVPAASIRVRNAAAVMVTANLPAFAGPGTRLDVNVASLGDAKSLTGGTLLMTPMRGPDGVVYAIAQGAISLGGGFAAQGGGASVAKNHPTTGTIPGGALVERAPEISLAGRESFRLELRRPDFENAFRIERALDATFGPELASALDPGTVELKVPAALRDRPMEFLAAALDVGVEPTVPARVVLNERTGTVVMGGDVRLSAATISHGNLTVAITRTADVSQPLPFSEGGQTVVVPRGEVETAEEPTSSLTIENGTRVADLVQALGRLGVTTRDMIAILEALRAAGSLHAALVVI